MQDCPHCHQRALSAWHKFKANPRHAYACETCGRPVTVPRASLALPIALPFLMINISHRVEPPTAYLLFAAMVPLFIVIQWLLVPLVPGEARRVQAGQQPIAGK